jgi:hypothetical protein
VRAEARAAAFAALILAFAVRAYAGAATGAAITLEFAMGADARAATVAAISLALAMFTEIGVAAHATVALALGMCAQRQVATLSASVSTSSVWTLWAGRGFFRARRGSGGRGKRRRSRFHLGFYPERLFFLSRQIQKKKEEPKMRRAIRLAEFLLVYGAYSLLRDVAFPLSLFMALGYLYCGVSMLVAIEWALLPILSLVFREESDAIAMTEAVD